MTITPNIQKIIDTANAMPEVISLTVGEVPAFELGQVPPGDYVYFDFVMVVKNGDHVPVAFVVPETSITENSYMDLAIKDLADCNCVGAGDADDAYCVDNPFYNRGKTTYYIRPNDSYLVRLIQQHPTVLPPEQISPNLQGMVEKLKTLDKVIAIQVEEVIDPAFANTMRFSSNPLDPDQRPEHLVIIRATLQLASITADISFICSEWQYDDTPNYTWAVTNLTEMIASVVKQTS
jgi:hypothetical protein